MKAVLAGMAALGAAGWVVAVLWPYPSIIAYAVSTVVLLALNVIIVFVGRWREKRRKRRDWPRARVSGRHAKLRR